MDSPNQDPSPRSLSIVSMEDVLSTQLMASVAHILLTEKFNYQGLYHEVIEEPSRNLFNNIPRKKLSITTEVWHSPESANSLIDYDVKNLPYMYLKGRFSLFLPREVAKNVARFNCTTPLENQPFVTHLNLPKLHSEIKEIFLENLNSTKHNQTPDKKGTGPHPLSVGLMRFGKYAIYRSKGCVDTVDGCLVIAASTYNMFGDCLVKMVKRTNSKVVILWIGHQALHKFVMAANKKGENVLYFGWNLDLLHSTGLFSSMEMNEWDCLESGCTWGHHIISSIITNDLTYSAFFIDKFMELLQFENNHITSMLSNQSYDWWKEGVVREAACDWLKENPLLWEVWTKDAPEKEPIDLMLFYAIEKDFMTLFIASVIVKEINNDKNILPNHKLYIHSYKSFDLSEGKHYRNLFNYLMSGMIKGGFGSTQNSFAGLPKWLDAFKTVYFSLSPSVDLDDEHAETFYSMTPELQDRFVAIGALFDKFDWSKTSLVVEEKSTLYKLLAVHMKRMLKVRNITLVDETLLHPSLSRHDISKKLEGIKEERSNIVILLISQPILDEVLCVLHHKGMTPKNDYVFIYITGLNPDLITTILKNEENKNGKNGKNKKKTQNNKNEKDGARYENVIDSSSKDEEESNYECSGEDLKEVLDKMFKIEERFVGDEKGLLFNKTRSDWLAYIWERIDGNIETQKKITIEYYYLFDSVIAFSLGLDHYLNSHSNSNLSDFTTEKSMQNFKESMATVNFSGLSGRVKFANMSRIANTAIYQYNSTEAIEVGIYYLSDESLKLTNKLMWAGGKAPPDTKSVLDKYPCNLQFISDIFKVSCNHAIVIFSAFIAILIMLPFIFLIFIFKKRFDDHSVVDVFTKSFKEKDKELMRSDILINRILGHGEFGTVYGGDVVSAESDVGMIPVAVKILKTRARDEDKVAFFAEAELMMDFDHENIVKLIGVCSIDEPSMVVMEFMMYGDLRTYMLCRRHLASNTEELGPASLTKMALDVAKGLQYLIKVSCVHRDLACRNCLVHESGVVKISDFGLTNKTFQDFYARCVSDSKFPIRWMAPECLKHGIFSSESDIWSYGILLYELFTFGTIPYHDLNNDEVIAYIKSGQTIELPESCSENLANLLKGCWSYKEEDRPSIDRVLDDLTDNSHLLKPCLDLPRPHIDPKESGPSGRDLKGLLFPRQWTSRLSNSSNTGLPPLRNRYGRAGSMQSPQKSPDVRQKTTDKKHFIYPSNIISKEGVMASKSEAGLQAVCSGGARETEKKLLLKGFEARKTFVRSISSEHKTSHFKGFKKNKKTSPEASIEMTPPTSKSHLP